MVDLYQAEYNRMVNGAVYLTGGVGWGWSGVKQIDYAHRNFNEFSRHFARRTIFLRLD